MLAKALASASASAPKVYVEDVFSTWLYTGNGSTQTITNGIDLSGKGGMVWIKNRVDAYDHRLFDTARGATKLLESSTTSAEITEAASLTSFTASGFTLDSALKSNRNGSSHTSWTFRKAAKFFDVVTYTGNGSSQTIAHNLGSVPGCIIVKRTDTGGYPWYVYHRSLTNQQLLLLDSTSSVFSSQQAWNYTDPTSTVFSVGNDAAVNANGGTYVAYLFAHDAGGFGDSGNDSVVSCGSFTTDFSGNATVNLGWEPQWLLVKPTSTSGDWWQQDIMRGMSTNTYSILRPNLSNAEINASGGSAVFPTATGFTTSGGYFAAFNATYIYIAIRRGPMKTPTDATKVFQASTYAGGTAGRSFNLGFVPDALLTMRQNTSNFDILQSRLTGLGYMFTNDTTAEMSAPTGIPAWDADTGTIKLTTATSVTGWNGSGSNYVNEVFRRAPGFFDVVAYTGTGVARTINHNLGVVPELGIFKIRSTTGFWLVYSQALGNNDSIVLQSDSPASGPTSRWDNTSPTNQVFTLGAGGPNASGHTYVGYLFATCPGVSKVGSYTGTGTTLNVDCGFTNGARFVLIKRTDSTGDWYVWDTARGIVSGNDSYLLLNSSAAEVTNTDYIDPLSSGFQISSTAPAAINANGGSFIYLAVA